MLYLECIAMLEFTLKKLRNGQRVQVPVSVVDDVQAVMVQINRKLQKENNTEITARIRDIMEAIEEVKTVRGAESLPDAMKNALTSGVLELLSTLRLLAFEFYKWNDFEPTEEIIPVMRSVVEEALSKGVI